MAANNGQKTIELRILRREAPGSQPYWENFSIPYKPNMNIISCLIEIARNPVNADGKPTTPVAWDCSCLEEVCGACSMLINGTPRQSCAALVDQLAQPIELKPLSKFDTVRDLIVDRTWMFENLKKIMGWVPIDGTYALGSGPKLDQETTDMRYNLSRCMTCACCVEACPQVNPRSSFIGPAAIGQVRYFNSHPTGNDLKCERLDVMMGDGGVHECGNAQNCVEVCPKELKLTDAIADVGRQVTFHAVSSFLKM